MRDLVFTVDSAPRIITPAYKPPLQLQCSRSTRAQFANSYYSAPTYFEVGKDTFEQWAVSLPGAHFIMKGSLRVRYRVASQPQMGPGYNGTVNMRSPVKRFLRLGSIIFPPIGNGHSRRWSSRAAGADGSSRPRSWRFRGSGARGGRDVVGMLCITTWSPLCTVARSSLARRGKTLCCMGGWGEESRVNGCVDFVQCMPCSRHGC